MMNCGTWAGESPAGGTTEGAMLSVCWGRQASVPVETLPELLPDNPPPLLEPLDPPLLEPLDPPPLEPLEEAPPDEDPPELDWLLPEDPPLDDMAVPEEPFDVPPLEDPPDDPPPLLEEGPKGPPLEGLLPPHCDAQSAADMARTVA